MRKPALLLGVTLVELFACRPLQMPAQTGSVNEPIRYLGGVTIHQQAHDGQLGPAEIVGTLGMRAVGTHHLKALDADHRPYNHAPDDPEPLAAYAIDDVDIAPTTSAGARK
jgi:hypothetical protein